MRHCTTNCVALHKIDMIWVLGRQLPDEGHSRYRIYRYRDPPRRSRHFWLPASRRGHIYLTPCEGCIAMANTDPFSSSVIPFEVPEQMRAFAEKGVSQARDNYAKFKDVAETHNGTIEAVFSTVQQGRQRILRQADGNDEGRHHREPRLRAGTDRREIALGGDGAVDLARPQAVRGLHRPSQGTRRTEPRRSRPKPPSRSRPTPRSCSSRPPDRAAPDRCEPTARAASPGFFVGRLRPPRRPGRPATVARNDAAAAFSRPCQSRALHLVSARFGTPFCGVRSRMQL